MTVFLVALGGALGACARFEVDRWVRRWRPSPFPWATLLVNVVGSFLLGVLVGAVPASEHALLGVGFCGALTTYSTFGYETVRLTLDGARPVAVLNVLVTIAAGWAAALTGLGVAALWY